MLDQAIPEPQPEEDGPEPWDDFMERIRRQELARDRAREAFRAAHEAGERDREMLRGNQWAPRPEPADRVALGVGPNGVRRVGIWDPAMRRYNIRDEE